MSTVQVKEIAAPVELGEGPHWDKDAQALYYVDINGSSVYKFVPATKKQTSVKIEGGKVSLVIPLERSKDKFVITVGSNVAILTWDGESKTPTEVKTVCTVDNEPGKEKNRINDGKADPTGRLWAGSIAPNVGTTSEFVPELASLFSFSGKDWKAKTHVTNITVGNGLAWSEDLKHMYYIDSVTRKVEVFDFDAKSGNVSNRNVAFDFESNKIVGLPDGMAIDTEGKLWVACFGGSKVIRVDPKNGKLLSHIDIPAPNVTSVAFGGSHLDEMFVTTANIFMSKEDLKKYPSAGATFRVTGLGVKGYPGQAVKV